MAQLVARQTEDLKAACSIQAEGNSCNFLVIVLKKEILFLVIHIQALIIAHSMHRTNVSSATTRGPNH